MAVTLYNKTIGVTPNIPQLTDEIDADVTISPKFVAPQGITFTATNALAIYMSDSLSGGEETALDAVIAAHSPNTLLSDVNVATYSDSGLPDANDDVDAGVQVGDRWFNTTLNLIYVCTDNTSGAAVWQQATWKNTLTETSNPTVNDDEGDGFTAGSYWLNTNTNVLYYCEDASTGAAVWSGVTSVTVFEAHANSTSNPHSVTPAQLSYTSTGWDSVSDVEDMLDALVVNWENLGGTGRFTPTTSPISQTGLNEMTYTSGTGIIMYDDFRKEVSWTGSTINTTGFSEGTYWITVNSSGTVSVSTVDVEPSHKQNIHLGLFYYGGTQIGTFRPCGCLYDSALTGVDGFFRRLGIFIYDNSGAVDLMSGESLRIQSPSTNVQLQYTTLALPLRDADDAGTYFFQYYNSADDGWGRDFFWEASWGLDGDIDTNRYNDPTANASTATSGNCTFTNGSSSVTSTTDLTSEVTTDSHIYLTADSQLYMSAVQAVSWNGSITTITLENNYQGTGGTGPTTINDALPKIPSGKWVSHLVARSTDQRMYMVPSQTYWDTEAEAKEGGAPEIPGALQASIIRMALLIFEQGETDLDGYIYDVRPLPFAYSLGGQSGGGSGTGDVTGPGSSTDNAVVRFDGTTGKIIQNSTGWILDDSGVLIGSSGSLTLPQGAAPTPTTEGQIAWDTNDDHLVVGDGSSTVTLIDDGTSASGDVAGTFPGPLTVTDLTISGEAQGAILYNDGSGWEALAPGTAGQALLTGGAAANPSWGSSSKQLYDAVVAPSGGDYTSVASAFAGGAKSVFVRTGTYVETANVVIPNGGALYGEDDVLINFNSAALSVTVDGNGGTTETTGTFSVTNGSAAVTGSGTTFTNLSPGNYLWIGTVAYPILSITDNTNLTLALNYNGESKSGVPMFGTAMFDSVLIRNVRITGSTTQGLLIRGCTSLVMETVTVYGCLNNIVIEDSITCGFTSVSAAHAAADGVNISTSRGLGFGNCIIVNNGSEGMTVGSGCIGTKIEGCGFTNNDSHGVQVLGTAEDTLVLDSVFKDNAGDGLRTEATTSNTDSTSCNFRGNGGYGANFLGTGNILSSSFVQENGGGGVNCGEICTISSNDIGNNTGVGIYCDGADHSVIVGNFVRSNTGNGIELTSTSDNTRIDIIGNRIDLNDKGLVIPAGSNTNDCHILSNDIHGNTTTDVDNSNSTVEFSVEANGNPAQGDILYHDGDEWARLAAGTAGQGLLTQGAGADPIWNDLSKELYDAVVAPSGGDYTLPSAAFAAGAKSVFVQTGTYVETADIEVPDGGYLVGEETGGVVIDLSGGYSLEVDGNGGTTEETGTISATNGSAAIVGSGTTFTNLSPGDYIAICNVFYPILSITDNTNLTLAFTYQGADVSGFPMFACTMKSQVRVQQLTIKDATGTGLLIRGCINSTFNGIVVYGCVDNIVVEDAGQVIFTSVGSFHGTNDGINISTSRGLGLSNCGFSNNGSEGVYMGAGCLTIKLEGISICSNGADGINAASDAQACIASNCVILRNDGKGINTEPTTSGVIVDGCIVRFNGSIGIDFDGDDNLINDCVVGDNTGAGIWGGDSGTISGCQINSNGAEGISLNGDADTVIVGNHIHDNTGDGIDVAAVSNTDLLIASNRIYDNGPYGIDIAAGAATNNIRLLGNHVSGHATADINNGNATTVRSVEAAGNPVQGDILYHDGTDWVRLGYGNDGEALLTRGVGADPEWGDPIPAAVYVDYYNTASFAIATTATTCQFNTTRQSNAAFTLSSNEVTCNTTGTYRVDFDLALTNTTTDDVAVDLWLEVDTVEVPGTRTRMLHDDYENVQSAAHGMAILDLTATEVLRVRGQVVLGTVSGQTLAQSARLMLHSIGANGATGPQGPAGSGSTVNIQDEGTPLANTPHSTLNFTGDGVTASDAGSGVATINIPRANIAQYRRTTNQTINTTATTISLDANDFEDSYYSRTGDNITVSQAGIYEVNYSVYMDTNAGSRRTIDAWVENNTTEIVPSRSSAYARNSTDDTENASATFFVQLAASDVLRLRAQSTGTAGTCLAIGNYTWLSIKYVRAV